MALTITKDSASAFTNSNISEVSSCRLSDTKYAIIYKDSTNNDCRVVVATISGTTITFGTPVQVYNSNIVSCSIDKLDTDKIIISYQKSSDYKVITRVATISGTEPTFGTNAGNYYSETTLQAVVVYNTDYFALIYNKRLVRGASVSGTDITFNGSAASLRSPAYEPLGGFFLDTNKIVCFCGASTSYPRFFIVSFTGTSASVGSQDEFISGQTGNIVFNGCCSLSTSKILVYYTNASKAYIACATISGDTFTWGTPYEYANANAGFGYLRKISETKALLTVGSTNKVSTISISTTTVSSNEDEAEYESGYTGKTGVDYLGAGYFQLSFCDYGDSEKGKSIIGYGIAPTATNTSNFFQLF